MNFSQISKEITTNFGSDASLVSQVELVNIPGVMLISEIVVKGRLGHSFKKEMKLDLVKNRVVFCDDSAKLYSAINMAFHHYGIEIKERVFHKLSNNVLRIVAVEKDRWGTNVHLIEYFYETDTVKVNEHENLPETLEAMLDFVMTL